MRIVKLSDKQYQTLVGLLQSIRMPNVSMPEASALLNAFNEVAVAVTEAETMPDELAPALPKTPLLKLARKQDVPCPEKAES